MGSGTKRKSRGQPETAGTNGTTAIDTSGDESADDEQQQVTVHLININRSVHEKTNAGDRATRSGSQVSVPAGVLGFISPTDLSPVEAGGFHSGHVSSLEREDNLSATVTFTM